MSLMSLGEVIEFAVTIEKNGAEFYRTRADTLSDQRSRDTFTMLAEDERRHAKFFQEMLDGTGDLKEPTSYPDQYFAYLQAYAENLVFSDRAKDELKLVIDTASALDFGIKREVDSILYYQEVKGFVPDEAKSRIDEIIDEERRHFTMLSKLREKTEA
jgi:rubrerythrin